MARRSFLYIRCWLPCRVSTLLPRNTWVSRSISTPKAFPTLPLRDARDLTCGQFAHNLPQVFWGKKQGSGKNKKAIERELNGFLQNFVLTR